MADLSRDYFILVFLSGLGTLQVAASYGHLRGLLLLPSPRASRFFGVLLALAVVIWFFVSAPRNINDTEGGLDGNTQALLFALASLAAVVATLVGSSIANAGMRNRSHYTFSGLDALKKSNYVQALFDSLSYWWRKWRRQMQRYFSG